MAKWSFSLIIFVFLLASCGDLEEAGVSSLAVSPSTATVGVNQSKLFSVIAYNTLGLITSISPTWSSSSGSISSTGLFTAGGSAGSATVTATYGSLAASSAVTITERAWIGGRVSGARDPSGVQGVLVALRANSNLADTTNKSGNYLISNIPAGTYEVYTQEDHAVYASASKEVTVASGETKTVNFFLTVRPGVPEIPTTTVPTLFE